MIFWILLLIAGALTFFIYIKNKIADRERYKRERFEEKQERLMDMIKNRKEHSDNNDTTD